MSVYEWLTLPDYEELDRLKQNINTLRKAGVKESSVEKIAELAYPALKDDTKLRKLVGLF